MPGLLPLGEKMLLVSFKQQRQSRFDQVSGSQFEQGFGSRAGMGGPGGNQVGPGGMGGGGMGGPGSQQAAMFQQMQGMGRPGPERAMMERRRAAEQPRDELADLKRMRRY